MHSITFMNHLVVECDSLIWNYGTPFQDDGLQILVAKVENLSSSSYTSDMTSQVLFL